MGHSQINTTNLGSAKVSIAPARKQIPQALLIMLTTASFFGLAVVIAGPQFISIALRVMEIDPQNGGVHVARILTTAAVLQIVTMMVVGRLSDATTLKVGMRKPWLIVALIGLIPGTVCLATATSIGMVWIGAVFINIAGSIGYAMIPTVISDHVIVERQGLASGLLGAAAMLGTLVVLFIVQLAPDNVFIVYVVPAICAIIPLLLLSILLRDRRLEESVPLTFKGILKSFSVNGRKSPNLVWFLPVLVLAMSVPAVLLSFGYFVIGAFDSDPATISTQVFIAGALINAVGFIVALLVGQLSDRVGRRKPFFVFAVLPLVLGGLVVAYSPSIIFVFIGFGIAGIGMGLINGSYIAIALETMSDDSTAARDMGVVLACVSVGFAWIPFMAQYVIGADGSGLNNLILIAVVATILFLPFMLKVKVR